MCLTPLYFPIPLGIRNKRGESGPSPSPSPAQPRDRAPGIRRRPSPLGPPGPGLPHPALASRLAPHLARPGSPGFTLGNGSPVLQMSLCSQEALGNLCVAPDLRTETIWRSQGDCLSCWMCGGGMMPSPPPAELTQRPRAGHQGCFPEAGSWREV